MRTGQAASTRRGLSTTQRLSSALVTAVVAPAGSGKTTFVRGLLSAHGIDHHWITVPEHGAWQDFMPPIDVIEPGLVVVDDSHHLPRTPDSRRLLDDALEGGWRFVFIGRTEPPASFWRLVGRGEGVMIGFEELLLTSADVARMASERDLRMSETLCAELHRVTRGWPALVEIVLETIERVDDGKTPERLPLTEVLLYVQAEVVEPLPEDLRTLCAHLAHLGTFTPEMARELIGDSDGAFDQALRSQAMLVRAAVSTDTSSSADTGDGVQLMFPPILEQVLRRDRTAPGPAEAAALHRRASRRHEGRGEWDRALTHMLQADPADAVRQLGRLISAMEPLGRTEEALQWFRQLPRKLRMQPASMVALALALVQAGLASEARQLLDQADTAEWSRAELAEIAMTESLVERVLIRHDGAVTAAQRALALLDEDTGTSLSPGRRAYLRVMATEQLREVRLWEGDPAAVRALMSQIEGDVIRSGHPLSLVHSTAVTAVAALDSGDLALASEKAHVALRLAGRRQFDDTHIVAEAHFVLAAIAAEHDDDAAAVERLIRTRTLAERGLFPTTLFRVELLLAPLLARSGRGEEAWAVLEALGTVCRRTDDPYLPTRLLAANALTALHTGDTKSARAMYKRLHRTTNPPDVVRVLVQLAAAMGLDADLDGLIRSLPAPHEPVDQVLTLMVKSQTMIHSNPERAVEDLVAALRLAEQLDLWRTVLMLTGHSGPLLAGVRAGADLTHGPSPSFVRRIAAMVVESSRVVSVLSAREAEIAQLLPSRKTNAQIASELYISENTVKTHLRHIYQKLGVEQRDEAVVHLERLGLLTVDRNA